MRDDCATAFGIVSASITTAIESASAVIGRDGRSKWKKRIILARIIAAGSDRGRASILSADTPDMRPS